MPSAPTGTPLAMSGGMNDATTRNRTLLAITVGLLFSLVSAVAVSSEPHTHDGFHARLGVRLVDTVIELGDRDPSAVFSGPGLLDGVQLGATPVENFTLFVEGDSLSLLDTIHVSADDGETRFKTQSDRELGSFLTGVGAGYYIMPANIYVSAAAGVAFHKVALTDDGMDLDQMEIGAGFALMAGKEWWVSDQWTVGLGAQLLVLGQVGGGNVFNPHTVATGMMVSLTTN